MKTIEEEFPPEQDIDFEQDLTAHYTRLRARAAEMERALITAIIELVPPARTSVCRRVLREALGQPQHQIYNTEPTLPPAPDLHQTKP